MGLIFKGMFGLEMNIMLYFNKGHLLCSINSIYEINIVHTSIIYYELWRQYLFPYTLHVSTVTKNCCVNYINLSYWLTMHAMMRTKPIVSNNKLFYMKPIYVNTNIAYILSYIASCHGFFLSRALHCLLKNTVCIHTCSYLLKLAEGSKLL